MPEYLHPGVYVEEIEIGAVPIEGVSTSTAGFLGKTERGPTDARLVTSFEEFKRLYSSYLSDSYLAYAVEGFFSNGGKRCFIGRIVAKDAAISNDSTAFPFTIQAIAAGKSGDNIGIMIGNATRDLINGTEEKPNYFKLIVGYWQNPSSNSTPDNADFLEIYDNLSMDQNSSDYYLNQLGDPKSVSNLIKILPPNNPTPPVTTPDGKKPKDPKPADATPATLSNIPPKTTTAVQFLGKGGDGSKLSLVDFTGSDTIGAKTGLSAFADVDEISIVYVPDLHNLDGPGQQTLVDAIITHCELLKDRFAILETPEAYDPKMRPPKDSEYAAYYYPWIEIYDPLVKGPKYMPPGGHIAGIYARSDTERGVHKAPANEVVRGVNDLKFNITNGDQDSLNPKGVNCIRSFPARGIRVWGARTMSSNPLWKYINVRRLFIYLEESIDEGTQWVVFEPNDEKLWGRVKQTITQFLTQAWKDGAFMGTTAEEAFFVKCDRTTMTQNDIDNGRLIVMIGVSPVKPAEFVIFRIAQWTAGAQS